ncbi:MAG: hypothetical protein DWB56_09075 [Candidatus Jettenia sp.]|uniref:Cytochrome c n=2 Tax=Candidatus Jettenia TaxID=360731 RepID=I3IH48_9BACT|nr:MAG: hypothetical protein EDM77_09110 [Candidatus Jettenia sp. AMX1]MBC6929097.1 hypothetical protein [Candidatus Jettenia sp.]WKZ16373.1 MAG: cytochrome c [Candidatus Jettenia caeni]MCE7880353.1 hypothetical protein [Candidatus Jettenia sp. AMX1]MCQ3928467.1 hypothetical protein [Candidatus Jettenia sp.]
MKKRFMLICLFTLAAGAISYPYTWNIGTTLSNNIESYHKEKPSPTRELMRMISSHMSKIFDAIMAGDHNTVSKESNAVAETSKSIMRNFFPEDGKIGEWFKETGKDPNNPEEVTTVKKDFEQYSKSIVDAAMNIAENVKKQNIVETYKNFDTMLKNACFACHETARPKWPEWPEWMQITGG